MEIVKIFPMPILLFISLVDIKKRIVPEIPTYILFFFSSLVYITGLNSIEWAVSTAIIFLFSFVLYLKGVIADGDFVLLTALSFLIEDVLEFLIIFFATSLLFLIIYSIYKMYNKDRRVSIALMILMVSSLIFYKLFPLISLLMLFASLLLIFLKKECLEEIREVDVEDLVEGDILLEDIKEEERILFKNPGRSLTKREIEEIKKLGVKKVKIRWGAPFVTVIAASYLIYIIWKSL